MRKKRFFAILLLLALLVPCALPAAASEPPAQEDGVESSESAPESAAPSQEVPDAAPSDSSAAPLKVYDFQTDYTARAKAAALIDVKTNTIVFSQALDEKLYPASLTKIMTCLLALEYGDLDAVATVSATALENLSEYGSTANLQEGEQISLRELLYCIMISSANEGCNVIAELISGSVENFVQLMNRRAAELGMTSTHYANTHGLHDDDHYTTVRDLATLICYAWQNPAFREFSTTTAHTVPATNLSEERHLRTTNYLLSTDITSKYYYSKASGIKTGFTTPAGGCLISSATDGELSFISIVCGCETLIEEDGEDLDMRFVETKRLLEFALENFAPMQVLSSTEMLGQPTVRNAEGRENVVVHASSDAIVMLPADCKPEDIKVSIVYDSTQALEAPLEAGQRVGKVTAMYQGVELATSDLVTLTAVERAAPLLSPADSDGADSETESGSIWDYWYLLLPIAAILILLCLLLILRAVNIRKAKKRAAARRRQREGRRPNG